MFIDDLKTYLATQGVTTGLTVQPEFYNEATAVELICISVYDTDPQLGRQSLQFMARYNSLKSARDNLYNIYNHFFDVYQPLPVHIKIGGHMCLIKPVSKPIFLRKDPSGLFQYVMSIEVWTQQN